MILANRSISCLWHEIEDTEQNTFDFNMVREIW
jgi:hypothetical protein